MRSVRGLRIWPTSDDVVTAAVRRHRRRASLLAAVAIVACVVAALATDAGRSVDVRTSATTVRGLVLVEFPKKGRLYRTTLISATGKRLPAPTRLLAHPRGLSPDGALIAIRSDERASLPTATIAIGSVKGGSTKVMLRGNCPRGGGPDGMWCSRGADTSFAWSPDSRRIAVSANAPSGATTVALFDRAGRRLRSFAVPAESSVPNRPGRAYHRLIAWSGDGAHLLLMQSDDYIDIGVISLDVATGALRTLDQWGDHHDTPTVAVSPNGRYAALTTGDTDSWGGGYPHAVIDLATGRPLFSCTRKCTPWSTLVWAPESRGFYTWTGGRFMRIDLQNHRTAIPGMRNDLPVVAYGSRLLVTHFQQDLPRSLWTLDVRTGTRIRVYTSKTFITDVIPLTRLP